ncbi:hypothetical protein JKP88DRAFT_255470 [Tribonema minus]|uniref:Uncharacterized protein n=1 Tax=Tribonema minus TaxID=303371 RepID=A0A836CGK2_9STRA|nr:hypothetical protein JKP88DRAFT_255470 [Tribonema minus]
MAAGLVIVDFMIGSSGKRRRSRLFSAMDIQLVTRAARAYCYNTDEEEAVEEVEGREQQEQWERPVYLTFEYQGINRELRTEMDLRTALQLHSAESPAPLPVRIFTDPGEHFLALTQKVMVAFHPCTTPPSLTDIKLQGCGHSAVLDDFPGTGREGVMGRNYISNRQATCEKLEALMNKKGFLIVTAPPDSGKTSLLQLFDRYLTTRRFQTVYFTCLGRGKGPNHTWSIDDELARLAPYKKNLRDLVEERLHFKFEP